MLTAVVRAAGALARAAVVAIKALALARRVVAQSRPRALCLNKSAPNSENRFQQKPTPKRNIRRNVHFGETRSKPKGSATITRRYRHTTKRKSGVGIVRIV